MDNTEKKRGTKNPVISWSLGLIQELFPVLLITYLVLILLETVFKGSVSSYFNLNILLIAVIIIGAAAVLTASSRIRRAKSEKLTVRSILMIIFVGLGGAVIIWCKTREIGWLSYLISVVSGGLIVLLSLLIWRNDDGEGDSER